MGRASLSKGIGNIVDTTRKVAICDDLLVTLLTFVTEWYVLYDEFSNFVIGGK
jgi:hypothetical protein